MAVPRNLPYLTLKLGNLAVSTTWGFALVFVLIRRLPVEDYASLIVVTALGAYVMACDLGQSAVVYARSRASWLGGDRSEPHARRLAAVMLLLYLALAMLASAIFSVACFGLPLGSGNHAAAFSLYFLTLAFALPWSIVRAALAASDRYLRFEGVEFLRRLCNLALVGALWSGMPFVGYSLLALLGWLLAVVALWPTLARLLGPDWLRSARDWKPTLASNLKLSGQAGQFSLIEFGVFNLPYLLLPALFSAPHVLVAFDVFYKVTRFGAQSNLVAFEASLPATSRALHDEDARGLRSGLSAAFAVSLTGAAAGSLGVLMFGDTLFRLLLGDATLVPPWLRVCMAAMLFADVFRAGGALLLLNTGRVRLLLPWCVAGACALLALAAVTSAVSLDFRFFMSNYVLIFAATSLVYFTALLRRVPWVGHTGERP